MMDHWVGGVYLHMGLFACSNLYATAYRGLPPTLQLGLRRWGVSSAVPDGQLLGLLLDDEVVGESLLCDLTSTLGVLPRDYLAAKELLKFKLEAMARRAMQSRWMQLRQCTREDEIAFQAIRTKEMLTAFYKKHDPQSVPRVDAIIAA